MKTTLSAIATLLLLSLSAFGSIKCHTPNYEKAFEMKGHSISFYSEEDFYNTDNSARKIASLDNVQSRWSRSGLVKTIHHLGHKIQIQLKDERNFDETEDTLTITAKAGHTMTYPLYCEIN